ncbi:hypothetical protein HU200_036083 [Digitaria exilis]|uniref:Uncharacterized protein n=1 Tax=Digitaria exilis TaxID=1010633 RepID=A0A835BH92_9POAL|nr:hypothetical protein HU200_036083 [Digitaria exilis]
MRPGGTCNLEDVHITNFMKRDGRKDHSIMNNHPVHGSNQVHALAHRVLTYLEHDMVTDAASPCIYIVVPYILAA